MKSKSLKVKLSTTGRSTEDRKRARLENLCALWQQGLRLNDWKVDVKFAHSSEFSGHHRGECRTNMNEKSAEVLILPTDGREEEKAEELVLIHELLHIHLNTLNIPDDRETETEQVINCLSETMYNLMLTVRALQ